MTIVMVSDKSLSGFGVKPQGSFIDKRLILCQTKTVFADMAELADAPDLESGPMRVQVRFLLSA